MDVEVIDDLDIDGPVLLPNEADLPFISKPYSDDELAAGRELGDEHGVAVTEGMAPIQVVGSGATVNDATRSAFDRATQLLGVSEGGVRARCTFHRRRPDRPAAGCRPACYARAARRARRAGAQRHRTRAVRALRGRFPTGTAWPSGRLGRLSAGRVPSNRPLPDREPGLPVGPRAHPKTARLLFVDESSVV